MSASLLSDPLGRKFQYLRLSVTEACNFRCAYCLPNGYVRGRADEQPLSGAEIANLVSAFAEIGIRKVRLTGGEPTLRRDLIDIVSRLARTPGIETVALTTNGYGLSRLAQPLKRAGLSALNISIDSLEPVCFSKITGRPELETVLEGLRTALEAGFESVKLNAVLLRGDNEAELERFLELARVTPVTIRFIELMQTAGNRAFFEQHHLPADSIRARLLGEGWVPADRSATAGPAVEYRHPKYAGRIGLIAPYSKDFCASCNRLRVTSLGALRLCLFGERDYSIRPLLQEPSQKPLLLQTLRGLIGAKPVSHLLKEGIYGNTSNLAAIGG